MGAVERIERRMADLAARKQKINQRAVTKAFEKIRGERTPTERERATLDRWNAIRDEEVFWRACRRIPQEWLRVLSGRQVKQLAEQADRYGLSFGGAVVDLAVLVPELFAFLAKHGRRILSADPEDPFTMDGDSPALERWREEKFRLARLERLEREGALLPIEQVHDCNSRLSEMLRGRFEAIQRISPEAYDILAGALDDYDAETERLYGTTEKPNGRKLQTSKSETGS